MSEEGNHDDSQTLLQYMTLRVTLLTNLSMLRQELTSLYQIDKKERWDQKRLDHYLAALADRRDELISIASQSLTSADFAEFKNMVETTLKIGYRQLSLRKLKKIHKKF